MLILSPLLSAPDLSTTCCVVVDKTNCGAVLGGRCGRCHAGWPGADYNHIEAGHPVTTSIPGCTISWQVRTC